MAQAGAGGVFPGLQSRLCWLLEPKLHHFHATEIKVDDVAQEVLRSREEHSMEGVTFSGGEPMQQATVFAAIDSMPASASPRVQFRHVQRVCGTRTRQRSILGSGAMVLLKPRRKRLWQEIRVSCLDFAILGRFQPGSPSSCRCATSRNQVLRLFSNRYTPADFSEELH